MKILLTGRNGQVGTELLQTLAPLGELIAYDRAGLDLADPDSIAARIREARPGVIVNAAAYTSVDQAETDRDLAFAVNATAPGIIAAEAKRVGALLLHYSTDYVFDGTKEQPYDEEDAPNPLNVYGASKLEGERAIAASGCRHLILRTSWVYELRGRNFLLTMLRLARERSELRVINDQFGAPTRARAVARATAAVLAAIHAFADNAMDGIYHMTAAGQTSWYGFAKAIVAHTASERTGEVSVVPIAAREYPLPARRPRNSVLSGEKLRRAFGVSLAHWEHELSTALTEYKTAR